MLLITTLLAAIAAVATIFFTQVPRVQDFLSRTGPWFPVLLWTCTLGLVGAAGTWGTPLLILLSLFVPPACAAVVSLTWRDHRGERALRDG